MFEILSKNLDENMQQLNGLLNIDASFDLKCRVLQIGGRKACFYSIDGFVKDDLIQDILRFFLNLKTKDLGDTAYDMARDLIPYVPVGFLRDIQDIIKNLLSGISILMIDGYDSVITMDCRAYPARSVSEPDKEKVMRGSKDGFVETLVANTALVRRRIRTPDLVMEMHMVGESSKTDVVVCYIQGRVDEKVLKEVVGRVDAIKIDALSMNQQSLAECLYQHKWYNPFPKFKFSERPDTTAACLLEGNIVILVDNSPSAMVIPTSVFDIIEDADEYYFPPVTGTYIRFSRFIINIFAVLVTPTFLLLMARPEWIPQWLQFIRIEDQMNVPLFWQFIILEFALDGLRLAALNTPSMLSTPLSVVAGIVLGDYTVSSGWFNAQAMLYMALVAISTYTQSNFELGYALKFMRIIILILTALFNVYGYVAGIIFTFVAIVSNGTISGKGYIYPLIPFDMKQLFRRFFRISLPASEK